MSKYVWIAAVASALALCPPAWSAVLVRSPYLQNATQNSVDVMWGSNTAAGTVWWGTSPGDYTNSVASTRITDTDGQYVHSARIDGLSPGQTVYYYVNTGTTSGYVGYNDDSYRATAAPAGNASFRFIAYGDSQPKSTQEPPNGPDRWGYPEVMAPMLTYNPALMVHAGDITDDGHLWQYNDWYFAPSASQGKSAPVYPVLGNHELRPGSNVQNFRDVYGLPPNSADGTEDYYSFDYGCVHFVALDTAIISGGQTPDPTRAAQQNAWLEADLAATEKPWTVVWYHRSMTQYSYIDSLWRSTFEANGVDLVFAGHQHRYSSHVRNGIHYIITGGAGSLLDGNPYYQDGWSSYNRGKSFSDDFHFIVIDASLSAFNLNVYDTTNALRDTITIAGAAPPVPGDANDDGVVNDADASILAAHWQQTTGMGWEHGDFNYDGVVNDKDVSILAAHWLQTREGDDSPVPEPAGVVLLLGGMVSLLLLVLQRRVASGT